MKKHLLLAAAGLIGCAASVMGQTSDSNYSVGSPIESLDKLETGTYIIQGYAKDKTNNREGVFRSTDSGTMAAVVDGDTKEIPTTYDATILWKIEVTEAVDDKTPKTFTIQSVKEGYYWSFCGSSNKTKDGDLYVNGSVIKTDGIYSDGNYGNLKNGDDDKAQFTFAPNKWDLESSGAEPKLKEGERFVVISTSVLRHANNNGNATSPGTPTLNMTSNAYVSWWNIVTDDTGAEGTQAWLQFVPVKIEAEPVDVTFTYPPFGDFAPSPVKAPVIPGTEDDAAKTHAPDFFKVAKVEKVDGSDNEYKVDGSWEFPFVALDRVFRADFREGGSANGQTCTKWTVDVENQQIRTRDNANAEVFSPENLFYFNGHEFDKDNRLVVTLHTTGLDKKLGCECDINNAKYGVFSENPTKWVVKTNSTGDGISLQYPGNVNAHANDMQNNNIGRIGVWNNVNSQNNPGSFIRFFPLTEADFNTKEWKNKEGDTVGLNPSLIDDVRESPTPDNVRKVFDPNNTTTQLGEINAEGGNAGMVYDLQGRRLAAPVRGINIIDGKKVLLNR